MEYTTLGRTGLKVSVAGFGCGGKSRAGQGSGKSTADSVALIHRAMDQGVNFFDTARSYGTESILGAAIKGRPRDAVIISTKNHESGVSAEQLVSAIDVSLKELQTDFIDVFHLHGVGPEVYDHAINELAPAMLREQERGKIRFLGITETSPNDHGQKMLQRAVTDDCWDVMMLGFNMMHQVARTRLFPQTSKQKIGTLIMFAVRSLFSVPGRLEKTMGKLAEEGRVPAWLGERETPLDFLLGDGGADSVIEAAYRFARHEPGADVVLFGTGDTAHLDANIQSILKPPLPEPTRAKLTDLFGHLEGIGLDGPGAR
ncbi:MAG: aldo/keto reductase [Alphaproteobacteria bacterium]|nr:aldo/keto reductase [Alphaproteobacteria bacterium]